MNSLPSSESKVHSEISRDDLIYLAGLIEGEGSLIVHYYKTGVVKVDLVVTTTLDYQRFRDILKKLGLKEYRYGKIKHYGCYNQERVYKILKLIKPFVQTYEWQMKIEYAERFFLNNDWQALNSLLSLNSKGKKSEKAKNFILKKLENDVCQKELKY